MFQVFMDFLHIVSGIASIIAILIYVRNCKGLAANVKGVSSSLALFLRLTKIKKFFLDVYKSISQGDIKTNLKPSLPDYFNHSFNWKSESDDGTTIRVRVNDEIEIFNNVTGLKASLMDPFSLLYELDIDQNKPGYTSYGKSILGIDHSVVSKLARQCYFREVVESQTQIVN